MEDKKISEITLKKYLADYLFYIKKNNLFSKNSSIAYKKDLTDFVKFFNGCSVEDIGLEEMLLYIDDMKKIYSENSIHRKVISVKTFYKYLNKKGIIDKLPTDGLGAFKPVIKFLNY